jgi:hypothetical protein
MAKIKNLFEVIIIVIFVLLSGCQIKTYNSSGSEKTVTTSGIEIRKTSEGFDIYRGENLLLEMTKRNTDSLSLETLNYIYDVIQEQTPDEVDPEDGPKEKEKIITGI